MLQIQEEKEQKNYLGPSVQQRILLLLAMKNLLIFLFAQLQRILLEKLVLLDESTTVLLLRMKRVKVKDCMLKFKSRQKHTYIQSISFYDSKFLFSTIHKYQRSFSISDFLLQCFLINSRPKIELCIFQVSSPSRNSLFQHFTLT